MFFRRREKRVARDAATGGADSSAAATGPAAGAPANSAAADPRVALEDRVRAVIDGFRPYIRADGGDIDFVALDERNIVRVRLRGACIGCPSSFMTLQMGLERLLREKLPEIAGVENVG